MKDSTSPQGESILLDRTNLDRALMTMVLGFDVYPPDLPRTGDTPSAALQRFQTALEQDAATVTTGFSLPRVIQRHRVFYVLRLLGFFFARDHTVVRAIAAPHPCRVLLECIIKVQGGADARGQRLSGHVAGRRRQAFVQRRRGMTRCAGHFDRG